MLDEWLAQFESELMNSSYNRYTLFLKQIFEIALADRMITESPVEGMKRTWKKPEKPVRDIPTPEQLEAIVKDVRLQRFNAEAEESADFIEFLGKAGLGQAEVNSLGVSDIEWGQNRIRVRRRKTKELFYVPIYPHLKGLLEKLCKKIPADAPKDQKLFKIGEARKSLANACKRLAFPNFTQRNIRQALIRRLWQSGVDYKLIAKWQGH